MARAFHRFVLIWPINLQVSLSLSLFICVMIISSLNPSFSVMEIPTLSTPTPPKPLTSQLLRHQSLLLPATSVPHLRQLHAHLLKHGARDLSLPLLSKLLSLSLSSASSSSSSIPYAVSLFHAATAPPISLCNRLLRELSRGQDPGVALMVYSGMREKGISLDRFSFPPLLKAVGRVSNGVKVKRVGREIHGMTVKLGFESDPFVQTALMGAYSAGGAVHDARRMFDCMSHRDLVAWGVMLDGYNQAGHHNDVLALFDQMQASNSPPPDEPIFSTVLSACARSTNLQAGTAIHSLISAAVLRLDHRLLTALVAMYAACGALPLAQSLFKSSPNPTSATVLISAYARAGDLAAAIALFNEISEPDLIAWTAMINAYIDCSRPQEALSLFDRMIAAEVNPDAIVILAVASAAGELGVTTAASRVHNLAASFGFLDDSSVSNALIAMHAKCGSLEAAQQVFDRIPMCARTIVSWTAMIHGYAIHGSANAAMNLFEQMKAEKIAPNEVTYLGLLYACAHGGMVENGRQIFDAMKAHGIQPGLEHYGCMVDLLGRAGLLLEAMKLIKDMPVEPNVVIWGALLSACKAHGNVDLGEIAARRVFDLDPGHNGAHVLLANLYAKVGMWEKVGKVRQKMESKGLVKERGSSYVEARGEVHEFSAGDKVNGEIRAKLEEIVGRLELEGYMVNTRCVFGELEGEERRKAVLMHSEKLALAFSLIDGTASKGVVRIAKNHRVCEDCHAFMGKFSGVFKIEVVLREKSRFHHFRDGSCSCNGFW